MTCEKRAGGLGYETEDAEDYAAWGVDYLKYDNCFNENVPALQRYPVMRDALNKTTSATGRPIFYSICNWGEEGTIAWAADVGNSWRTTQDIFDGWSSVEFNFHSNAKGRGSAGPGGWNDPDMLEVGNGGLTLEEEKSHFALWAMSKAPLIIGCDLTTVSPESLAVLKNTEIIAINQDPESEQAECILGCGYWERFIRSPSVWVTTLGNGDVVAAITNWRETWYSGYKFALSEIGVTLEDDEQVDMRDLNDHVDIGTFTQGKLTIDSIPGHGTKVYKFHVSKKRNTELS